ncbi:MAG: rRNA maturation RNase YbeY [Candidatus Pelagibacter sp.]|nr:rRNA maturation RNase YbeY [Candidatus Pelagibacter sp.]OUV86922.1 MAG: rRNA maturation RNase YbeY [Pelagibacteraceae bacterium TMED136]|tara:strand:- start:30621 stop:31073 length:453 start_codon:yes stop_codon:yes gene_type:complete
MHKTNIFLDSKKWSKHIPNIEMRIKKILKRSIECDKKLSKKKTEMTILLTSSSKMKWLNYKFRKIKKDTDVLSFPNEMPKFFTKNITSKSIYLGDLALSFEYINKQNEKFDDYLKKILVHGFLHLIGHNHDNNKSYLKMERAQVKITGLK